MEHNKDTELRNTEKLERFYNNHKKAVKKWRDKNKDTLKVKQKIYMTNLNNDPERHKAHLEKRRLYYHTVVKPKKEGKKPIEKTNFNLPKKTEKKYELILSDSSNKQFNIEEN